MTLDEIITQRPEMKGENWPSGVVAMARELDIHLSEPGSLKAIAGSLIEVAQRLGCDAVAGASPIGERLAGAVVASSDGLRLFSASQPAKCVLLLDGMLATGVQLARAIQDARVAGAEHTPAAALVAEHDALEMLRLRTTDEVVALREY